MKKEMLNDAKDLIAKNIELLAFAGIILNEMASAQRVKSKEHGLAWTMQAVCDDLEKAIELLERAELIK